jgi:hypothetical protein
MSTYINNFHQYILNLFLDIKSTNFILVQTQNPWFYEFTNLQFLTKPRKLIHTKKSTFTVAWWKYFTPVAPCSDTWEFCSGGTCYYRVDWSYHQTTDDITFTISARTQPTKWVAIGFWKWTHLYPRFTSDYTILRLICLMDWSYLEVLIPSETYYVEDIKSTNFILVQTQNSWFYEFTITFTISARTQPTKWVAIGFSNQNLMVSMKRILLCEIFPSSYCESTFLRVYQFSWFG